MEQQLECKLNAWDQHIVKVIKALGGQVTEKRILKRLREEDHGKLQLNVLQVALHRLQRAKHLTAKVIEPHRPGGDPVRCWLITNE